MKLVIDPEPKLELFSQDLELVIHIVDGAIPEVYKPKNAPSPDRHLMVGLAQMAEMAVSERDPETFTLLETGVIKLINLDIETDLIPTFFIARSETGKLGILAFGDRSDARKRAREAVRYFTGTIRLDIP